MQTLESIHAKSNGTLMTEFDYGLANLGVVEEMTENGSSNCLLPGERLLKKITDYSCLNMQVL